MPLIAIVEHSRNRRHGPSMLGDSRWISHSRNHGTNVSTSLLPTYSEPF